MVFVYLAGTHDQIARRLAARQGHFMPVGLLDSQFATLEVPTPDEDSITVSIAASAPELADEIVEGLHLPEPTGHEGVPT